MARTSKSPRAVLLAALATATQALPLYSHRNSPRKFTQHQLFACLVLKCFLKTDYRGVVAHLADCPSLIETLGLAHVPHYTTLQKAARRLLASAPAKRLLDATVHEHLGRKRCVARAAIDSTGLESTATSGYFVRRRRYVGGPWKTVVYHRFPKLGVVCDVQTHFILAAHESRGPNPDVADFRPLLAAALARVRMGRIAADAGFDSEPNHAFARRECQVRSIIPAKHGRPTSKPASGHYRRLMQTRFDTTAYRDRVQVETVISMLKRRLEAFVRGRNCWSQRRDLRLKVLTHNVMILIHIEVFYRAILARILPIATHVSENICARWTRVSVCQTSAATRSPAGGHPSRRCRRVRASDRCRERAFHRAAAAEGLDGLYSGAQGSRLHLMGLRPWPDHKLAPLTLVAKKGYHQDRLIHTLCVELHVRRQWCRRTRMTPKQAIAFVKANGVVLESGRGPVPSLAEAIAGEPIRGSWWAHSKANTIFLCSRAIRESADMLVCRLVGGKVTYVHRRLWPALVRLSDQFDADRLAAIQEVHTPSGKHEVHTTAYPGWVAEGVRRSAEELAEKEAASLLPVIPGRIPPKKRREGRLTTTRRST